ncbi:MAG: hypothetical protein JXR83_23685 [Deltaproteobacteria bacterium]|nr:hypothetical protein [Deltaproteobacteria bacterium]
MTSKVLEQRHPAATVNIWRSSIDDRVALDVTVDDKKIREEGLAHDGYEKVFALVPKSDGSWQRYDLEYAGPSCDRDEQGTKNTYSLFLSDWDDVTLDDLRQKGVAFGLEVSGPDGKNAATVWLQGFGDNYRLRD